MQITVIDDPRPLAGARPRQVIQDEITGWREKRIAAAEDPTVSSGTFRCLSNFVDAAILDLRDELGRATD